MLTTDKRFLLLEDARWDLRKHHTSDKIVVKIDEDEELEEDLELKDTDEEESNEETEDSFNIDNGDEDEFDDSDDDLKDLVILDEDELEAEE